MNERIIKSITQVSYLFILKRNMIVRMNKHARGLEVQWHDGAIPVQVLKCKQMCTPEDVAATIL